MAKRKPATHAIDAIDHTAWAITPQWLNVIRSIASRETLTPEMLEAIKAPRMQGTLDVTFREGGIAIVPVIGPIFRHASLFTDISGATALETLATDFETAQSNPNTRHIVLNIGSPGGEADGIVEFSDQIARSSIPVTAYVGGTGASGAYAIAAAATQTGGRGIIVNRMAVLGSVGVVVSVHNGEDDVIEIVSSNAGKKRPKADTDEGREVIQTLVDDLESVFFDAIAGYLDIGVDDIAAWEGGLFVGQKAVDAGLAHGIGDFETLISELSDMTQKKTTVGTPAVSADAPDLSKLTAAELREANPQLVESIENAARADAGVEAAESGAKIERERIKGLFAAIDPKAEERYGNMWALFFDGTTTADNPVLRAFTGDEERMGQRRAEIAADRDDPLPVSGNASATGGVPKKDRSNAEGDDFMSAVDAKVEEGMSRSNAVRWVATNRPDLHDALIDSATAQH